VANFIYGMFFGSPRSSSGLVSARIPEIVGLLAAMAWTILLLKLLWEATAP
jgi:hypothetical protein